MENDSDYGGTFIKIDTLMEPEQVEYPETTIHGSSVMDFALPGESEEKDVVVPTEMISSIENPEYTDSVSSNNSQTKLLHRDEDKVWISDVIVQESDDVETRLLENPAYIDSITSTGSQLASMFKSEDQNDDCTKETTDEFYSTRTKEFEVSIVEIVPHVSQSLPTEPLWESSAYIDQFACPSPGTTRLERVCKSAALNLSQDISCKGSMKGSTLLPVLINQVPEPVAFEEESFFQGNEIKNLFVISVSVSLMNAALSSLRNLQSSLNHKDGLGLYSLAASCGTFTFLSLFTPSLIQQFRPKRCLILAIFAHLVYVAANVIPEFFILLPVSALQGGGSALLWNSVSTYVTYLARSTAIRNDKKTVDVAGKYFGVFFCFFQLSLVVGNLISSIVLHDNTQTTSENKNVLQTVTYLPQNGTSDFPIVDIPLNNLSKYDHHICGSKYCHSYPIENELDVTGNARYNLLGVYGVATVLSLILPLFLMDSLKNYRTTKASCQKLVKQASSVIMCIAEPRFLSCLLMFIYSNMELGFIMGEVTKGFVTCSLGIHMVGYTMICFGVCGSLSSFIGGKLEKHIGCVTLIASATILDLVLLAVMLVWQPKPEPLYYYFLLLGAWGVGDGIWMSQVNCVISRLFVDKLEEAFASLRVVTGLGITIGFAYATSLCMTEKIYILLITCITGTIIYVISEIVRKCNSKNDEKNDQE